MHRGNNFLQLLSTASKPFGKHNAVLSGATSQCAEAAFVLYSILLRNMDVVV